MSLTSTIEWARLARVFVDDDARGGQLEEDPCAVGAAPGQFRRAVCHRGGGGAEEQRWASAPEDRGLGQAGHLQQRRVRVLHTGVVIAAVGDDQHPGWFPTPVRVP